MADEAARARITLINHLPAAGPDWSWRWQARLTDKDAPWRRAAETRARLHDLADRYQRVPEEHTLWSRAAAADPPPLELWYAGELPPPPYLTVVGPRQPSPYARSVVERFMRVLAPRCTIVSGLARGIDNIALTTALAAGGRTIAVVPVGLDEAVRSGGVLTRKIMARGALVAERLFIPHLSKSHFLYRNRLLATFADAVFIPEAGERSGTFNTITHALKLGVDIYVAPGDLDRATAQGSNRLIQEGAAVALQAADLAAGLGIKITDDGLLPDVAQGLKRGAATTEEIAARLGWSLDETMAALAAAQQSGLVQQDWLGRYRLLAGSPN